MLLHRKEIQMHLLNLLPPSQTKEELENWRQRVINARPVLDLVSGHINKQLRDINLKLDDDKIYELPGCDRMISGLLKTRMELKKLRELLINEVNINVGR